MLEDLIIPLKCEVELAIRARNQGLKTQAYSYGNPWVSSLETIDMVDFPHVGHWRVWVWPITSKYVEHGEKKNHDG